MYQWSMYHPCHLCFQCAGVSVSVSSGGGGGGGVAVWWLSWDIDLETGEYNCNVCHCNIINIQPTKH